MSKVLLIIGLGLEFLALIVFLTFASIPDTNSLRSPSLATLGLMIGSCIASAGFALAGGCCLLGLALVGRQSPS